jgi:hypothetical protein
MWVRNVDFNKCVSRAGMNLAGICKCMGIVGEGSWIDNNVNIVVCGLMDPRDKIRFAIALPNLNCK